MTTHAPMTPDELRSRLRRLADTGTPSHVPELPDPEVSMATISPLPSALPLRRRLSPLLAAAAAVAVLAVAVGLRSTGPTPVDTTSFTGAWLPMTPAPIPGRSGAASIVIDGELLVFGGQDPDGTARADAAAYDPRTDVWRRLPDMPTPLGSAVALRDGEGVLLVPVFRPVLTENTADDVGTAVRFDPATDSWSQPEIPADVLAATSVEVDGIWTPHALLVDDTGTATIATWANGATSVVASLPPGAVDGPFRWTALADRNAVWFVADHMAGWASGAMLLRLDVATGTVTPTAPSAIVDLADVGEWSLVESLASVGADGAMTVVSRIIDNEGSTTRLTAVLDAGATDWRAGGDPERDAVGDLFAGMTLTDAGGVPVLVGGIEQPGLQVGGLTGRGAAREWFDGQEWRSLDGPGIDLQRVGHVAAWTGTHLLVWGGLIETGGSVNRADATVDDGARFAAAG